jgi:light-regulated signal transduction histidine kinase (bacteriophytochrome)/CheY-like chemotaxis protein/HPt (histidine-containing phosphotransfer) domain-containing protein
MSSAKTSSPWVEACERESLHRPGFIQTWGALLATGADDLIIRHASANLGDFIGTSGAAAIGRPLAILLAEVADHPDLIAVRYGLDGMHYVDIERAIPQSPPPLADGAWSDALAVVNDLREAPSSAALFAAASTAIRRATGFDRAMFYRFDSIGHGEVVGEDCCNDLEPFLGINYPASDVPRQARVLYLRQRVRLIADARAMLVPILSAAGAEPTPDLSDSALRAVSPYHLEYLRNMGVPATLAVSLIVDGALWGMLVCHHRQACYLPPAVRARCDLVGQVTSLMVASLRDREARAEARRRRIRIGGMSGRVAAGLHGAGGLASSLADTEADLLALTGSVGALIRLGGRMVSVGVAPVGQAATALVDALLAKAPEGAGPFAWNDLGALAMAGRGADAHAGALLLPVAHVPGDAVVWLRPERARTVRWGGDPTLAAQVYDTAGALRPRRSFAVWREEVRGKSLDWTADNLEAASDLRRELDRLLAGYAEEMRVARDHADRALRAKSEFLATMSHEIRSPMSGLLGVLELLRNTRLDGEQTRMAGMIHNSASMLLAVLNDILDFSKIEAGALSVNLEATSLRATIGELVQPYVVSAKHKGIDLALAIDPTLPSRLLTDRLRLRQILNNLLSNALKFTAAGNIAVRVDRLDSDGGPRLRIGVSDSGIGMTDEVLARLFNPFMQADGSTTRTFGGTGLGLAISKKLAELLDGSIVARSRMGEGSEFSLEFPLLACTESAGVVVAAEPPSIPQHRGGHVLVIDDDQTIRWLSQRQLEMLGFRVDSAEDGEAGLQKLRSAVYDLVLTDCHMPRMDGVAFTRAVRSASDPAMRCLPIIGLTADVTEAQYHLCVGAGMVELAIKPLTVERLSRLVSRHLSHGDATEPVAQAGHNATEHNESAEALRAVTFDDQIYLAVFEPGDPDGAAWLGNFLDTAREDVAILKQSLGGDYAVVGKVAHRLAGAAFSAGAMLLGDAARALESAAKAGDGLPLPLFFAGVEACFTTANEAIQKFLAAGTAVSVS